MDIDAWFLFEKPLQSYSIHASPARLIRWNWLPSKKLNFPEKFIRVNEDLWSDRGYPREEIEETCWKD